MTRGFATTIVAARLPKREKERWNCFKIAWDSKYLEFVLMRCFRLWKSDCRERRNFTSNEEKKKKIFAVRERKCHWTFSPHSRASVWLVAVAFDRFFNPQKYIFVIIFRKLHSFSLPPSLLGRSRRYGSLNLWMRKLLLFWIQKYTRWDFFRTSSRWEVKNRNEASCLRRFFTHKKKSPKIHCWWWSGSTSWKCEIIERVKCVGQQPPRNLRHSLTFC